MSFVAFVDKKLLSFIAQLSLFLSQSLNFLLLLVLCEKCSNTEFFWFVISRIWNEYRELLYKYSHTV